MKNLINISISLKRTVLFVVILLCAYSIKAQLDPVYTQYMNNLMSVNPAYTGVRGIGSASLISRKQWAGLENSPFTTSLTLNLALDSLKIGGGFDFLYDNVGPASTTALFLDYSYRIKATQNTQLSFGLKAGFNYMRANLLDLYRYHYDDEPILEYGDFDNFMPNFGVGLFWFGDNFYAGLAIPRLLQNKYYKDTESINAASREERHYFLHGAYQFDLSPAVSFKPGLTTIMVAGAPVTADFDFCFLLYETVGIGAMYRISDAIGGYAQVQVDNFKFGFSYDYSHTRLSQHNFGTFEFLLRYDFKLRGSEVLPLPE